ncbi:unnamed protein product, partial [Ectocarpus fasciculatus]
ELCSDCRDHALCGGLRRRQDSVPEDVQALHLVLRAAQSAASLRLRPSGGEVGVGDGGVTKERLPRRRRRLDPHPRAGRLQRAQVPCGRPSPLRGNRQ